MDGVTLDGTLFIPVRTGLVFRILVLKTIVAIRRVFRQHGNRGAVFAVHGLGVVLLTVLAQAHVERAVRCALRRARGRVRYRRRSARGGRRRGVTAVTGRTVTLVAGLVFRIAERPVIGPEPVRFHSSFALDFFLVAVHSKRRYVRGHG